MRHTEGTEESDKHISSKFFHSDKKVIRILKYSWAAQHQHGCSCKVLKEFGLIFLDHFSLLD